MVEVLAGYIEQIAQLAPTWGFVIIFILMAVESSFIPFPSEVVMIPAGFLAYRCGLTFGVPLLDLLVALLCGTLGALLGAYINYWLGIRLGRPFLHKYGKYFFLKEHTLTRAEEIFRTHGDITTFVCRLIPAIRQIISIPAGISGMRLSRFFLFTGLGAGIWNSILIIIGWFFGKATGDMTYLEMINRGKEIVHENFFVILICLILIVVCYSFIHKKIMGQSKVEE